jgi:hypothetical protein
LAGDSYQSTKVLKQKKMQKSMTKNSLNKSTISYCRRNNINEKQLIKAINWYLSAKRSNQDIISRDSYLKT